MFTQEQIEPHLQDLRDAARHLASAWDALSKVEAALDVEITTEQLGELTGLLGPPDDADSITMKDVTEWLNELAAGAFLCED